MCARSTSASVPPAAEALPSVRRLFRSSLQVPREVLHVHHVARGHHGGMANDVLELPHIARPRMLRKPDLRPMRHSAHVLSILRGEAGNEMALEQREVFFALRQPRHFDFHHREAVVQILPKTLLGDRVPQVVIGGGNDTNIHFAGAQRSHSLHFLILEHAQEFCLSGERHVSDLIQKQRASVGVLE